MKKKNSLGTGQKKTQTEGTANKREEINKKKLWGCNRLPNFLPFLLEALINLGVGRLFVDPHRLACTRTNPILPPFLLFLLLLGRPAVARWVRLLSFEAVVALYRKEVSGAGTPTHTHPLLQNLRGGGEGKKIVAECAPRPTDRATDPAAVPASSEVVHKFYYHGEKDEK